MTCHNNFVGKKQGGGGITPIGAVSGAATVVKMQSNGQGTSWGLVKRLRGVLGTLTLGTILSFPTDMPETIFAAVVSAFHLGHCNLNACFPILSYAWRACRGGVTIHYV